MRRSVAAAGIVGAVATAALVIALASVLGGSATARLPSPTPAQSPTGSASPSTAPSSTSAPPASPAALPTPTPAPTPTPGPSLVAGPLDGLPTTAAAARRHPIAVMVDDLSPARPQSGFSSASIVWQAPAEGGIPRYMMIFNENLPRSVGPIRSSRLYFIAWAAEWRAVYVHVGGSPQALATLRSKGHGQLVYNADGFVYEGRYLYRIATRLAPHNEYSDAKNLTRLTAAVGAKDGTLQPAWKFGPAAPLADRPKGGTIDVSFPANHIHYAYDRVSNTYRRSVAVEGAQHDAATGQRVAPTNVVAMVMHFGPLNDGHPDKKRLEAQFVGSGPAWISTNGVTVRGTWRKASIGGPTRLFDRHGRPVTLTAGQTFVQVVESATQLRFVAGKPVIVPPRPGAGVN
ncbi:MAG TPA: DUF3048 domain-containing protein [Candidatus Limnocylindrales bacterium]